MKNIKKTLNKPKEQKQALKMNFDWIQRETKVQIPPFHFFYLK